MWVALGASGCALFGDPLLGTWELAQHDLHDPLTTTEVDGDRTTTTALSGELVVDTLDGSSLLGLYTERTRVTVVGPEGEDLTRSKEEGEVDAREEARGEYELDVDGFDDWLCVLEGTELDCEDDDANAIRFDRVSDAKKKGK